MKAYKVYYDYNDKTWKYDKFLSEVCQTSDFEHWNATLLDAESACIHHNENLVINAENMSLRSHYTICTCKECKKDYILTYDEYSWFLDRNLNAPKRCPKCRKRK